MTPTDQPINLPPLPEPYSVASTIKCVACGAPYEPARNPAPNAAGGPFSRMSSGACKCGSTSFAGTIGYDSPSPAVYTAGQMQAYTRAAILAERAAQSEAQSPALLFQHDDGRYAVAHAGAAFLVGDPAWHRVGPVEVHGAQSPQGAPVAYLHPITHPNWLDVCEPGSPGAFPVFATPQGGEAAQAQVDALRRQLGQYHDQFNLLHAEKAEAIRELKDAYDLLHATEDKCAALKSAQAGAPGRSEQAEPGAEAIVVAWVVEQWNAEVKNRPLVNVNRARLDEKWRSLLRRLKVDHVVLIGPTHEDLIAGMPWLESATPQPLLHGAPESARQPLTEDRVRRLQDAIEGECDGLAISPEHARAILEWVDGIDSATAMKAAGARE